MISAAESTDPHIFLTCDRACDNELLQSRVDKHYSQQRILKNKEAFIYTVILDCGNPYEGEGEKQQQSHASKIKVGGGGKTLSLGFSSA